MKKINYSYIVAILVACLILISTTNIQAQEKEKKETLENSGLSESIQQVEKMDFLIQNWFMQCISKE